MDLQKLETLPPPPGVIASLQAGFNIVSSRVALIFVPFILDVVVWLGPRLSIGDWFGQVYHAWLDFFRQYGNSPRELEFYTVNASRIIEWVGSLNAWGWVRTVPIGVPALMLDLQQELLTQTPLGVKDVIQLPSAISMLGAFGVLVVIGWLAGGWYFRLVAGASLGESEASISFLRAFIQTVILSVLWFIGLIILILPVMFLISLLAAIHMILAQIAFFIIMFFIFWLVVPLFFMPHGIFVYRQNALISILSSLRMSRFTLPTSSMFVFSEFILWLGLGYLWRVPAGDSWLKLVGLAGYAFISTMLLAASFVYYRDMNTWLQAVYQRMQQLNSGSSIKKV